MDPTNYSNILIELGKAVKMHNFYPDGHPNLNSVLEKCFLIFKKQLETQKELKWKVDQKGFYDNKTPIGQGNPEIAGLAKKLFFRRVNEITITRMLTQSDIRALLSIFTVEPEGIEAIGGPEAFFAERGAEGILVNALTYEELKRLQREIEARKEKERLELAQKEAERQAAEAAAQASQESAREGAEQEPAPPVPSGKETRDEVLDELIRRIGKETDPIKYKDLSVRIREKISPLVVSKEFDKVLDVMTLFLKDSSSLSRLPESVKHIASESLESIFDSDIVQYVINLIASRENNRQLDALQRLLLRAGEPAIEPLLDALIDSPEVSIRRMYYDTLLLFGKVMRPYAQKRMVGTPWFAIRQMVALLGDLGDPASIDALEEAYANDDMRIKKEVLKSIVRIHSPRSAELLIKALAEQDQGLVSQAIISLGVLKDASAIDVLGEIATKNDSYESRKEAVKSLGIIGDERGVPYLTKVLFKKVWFGKKTNNEVRSLAASSLGLIGGDEALGAIEKTSRDAEGDLYNTCRRILEGRENSIGQNR